MQTFSQSMTSGQTTVYNVSGRKFQILQGAGSSLDVQLQQQASTVYYAKAVGVGMWAQPDGGFSSVVITNNSASTQTVQFFVTMGDAGYDQPVASLTVSGQIDAKPVLDTTLTHLAAVTVGTAATALVAQDTTRRGLRIFNAGTVAIYLGGAGVTVANGALMLQPNGYYDETQAPSAAWYGISGTAGQSVRVMEIR